jgi:FKBP-type peptidyl-prolyl cis-trans isomerase
MRAAAILVTVFVLGLPSCKAKQGSPPPAASVESVTAVPSASAQGAVGTLVPNIPAPPDVATAPADAEKAASGLASKVLTKGTGTEHPRLQDRVRVHYTGWTKGGEMFDSSVARGDPAVFGVGQVIPGWSEALQLMVQGEKRRLWIPAKLAYGEQPRGGAPAGDLTFDVELLEVMKAPDPPKVPEDVAAAPKTAKKTASGIAYRVLKPGTGKHPGATDIVRVHYSGWTTDGKMFDSSVMRGQPISFGLSQVIKGWTEGVQLMKVGEKTRFWIPGNLAYGDTPTRPGAPAGMLVFDIELFEIVGAPAGSPSAKK